LPRDGRPHHVLTRVETFQRAALDSVAFVSWFTLTFKGWELALEEWQVELVRNCAFREREKKGGFLNLSLDYGLANFEFWLDHGVPIYYLWSEALHHDKRFLRAHPDVLTEYWEMRQSIEDDEEFYSRVRSHFRSTGRSAIFEYDNFFQDHTARSLLINTPMREFEAGNAYVMEAFQGYRPFPLWDKTQISRLLRRYETALLPNTTPPKLAIMRWAPREPWRGQPGEESYTVDYGVLGFEEDSRFPGRSFDEPTRWFTNDILVLRELFKVSFAPDAGEAYMPDGTRLQDPLLHEHPFDFVAAFEAKVIQDAITDGKERPADLREYYEYELEEHREKLRQTQESVRETQQAIGYQESVSSRGYDEEEHGPHPPRPANLNDMPELLKRMLIPDWRSNRGAPSHAGRARRERDSYSRRDSSRGASSSASSRILTTTSRRSASPSRGPSRLADPTLVSEEIFRPGDEDFEDVLKDFIDQLEFMYSVIAEPHKRRSSDQRAPRLAWDTELVERGFIHLLEYVDALRLMLYAFFVRSLDSPARVLNYLIERGIRFVLYMPRDPIPAAPLGLQQEPPSEHEYHPLQGLTGASLFRAWEGSMKGPFWAKTHFGAFIQEGGTIGFLTRHYAKSKLLLEGGAGVSLEARIFTRNSGFLPDSDEVFQVVHDELGIAEKGFALGTVLNPAEAQPVERTMFPPTHVFEHKNWNLGTGEWTDWEEDYMEDLLRRWKLGKEVPRTAEGWAGHMRVYRNGLSRSRPLEGRDARSPSSTEARKWCNLLREFYGFSPMTRKISSIADIPEPLLLRRFA
ncbi:hypothetical protein K523DRAFT_327180, partial [Schizophyllum commune Tattone D]